MTVRKFIGWTLLLLPVICAGIFSSSLAFADVSNASSLAVNPSIIEKIVPPGISSSGSFQLVNVLSEPLPVQLSAQPMGVYGADPAVNWISFPQPDIILQPKQVQSVNFNMNVPKHGEPGGHYLIIYVTPLVPANLLTGKVSHQIVRVGVMLSLIVEGKIIQQESITSFKSSHSLYQSTPVKLSLSINNGGNIHQLLTVNVSIYNYDHKLVKKIVLPDQIILPKTTKKLSLIWNKSWAFGPYTAKVNISYGTHHQQITYPAVHFWVIPWALIIIYLILLLIVIYVVKRARHKWIRAFKALIGK